VICLAAYGRLAPWPTPSSSHPCGCHLASGGIHDPRLRCPTSSFHRRGPEGLFRSSSPKSRARLEACPSNPRHESRNQRPRGTTFPIPIGGLIETTPSASTNETLEGPLRMCESAQLTTATSRALFRALLLRPMSLRPWNNPVDSSLDESVLSMGEIGALIRLGRLALLRSGHVPSATPQAA
jgi:hypothetical protein